MSYSNFLAAIANKRNLPNLPAIFQRPRGVVPVGSPQRNYRWFSFTICGPVHNSRYNVTQGPNYWSISHYVNPVADPPLLEFWASRSKRTFVQLLTGGQFGILESWASGVEVSRTHVSIFNYQLPPVSGVWVEGNHALRTGESRTRTHSRTHRGSATAGYRSCHPSDFSE